MTDNMTNEQIVACLREVAPFVAHQTIVRDGREFDVFSLQETPHGPQKRSAMFSVIADPTRRSFTRDDLLTQARERYAGNA